MGLQVVPSRLHQMGSTPVAEVLPHRFNRHHKPWPLKRVKPSLCQSKMVVWAISVCYGREGIRRKGSDRCAGKPALHFHTELNRTALLTFFIVFSFPRTQVFIRTELARDLSNRYTSTFKIHSPVTNQDILTKSNSTFPGPFSERVLP